MSVLESDIKGPGKLSISSEEGAELLCAQFRLTKAEARIALGIARGETLAFIAQAHGISVMTARTQLKAVFLKTATHRQAQLTALLVKLGI